MQGYQSESKFRGIGRSTLAMSRAIIRNAGPHRVSILINGLFPLQNVEDVRNAYRDILAEEEMFIFSGYGPTAYRNMDNHERFAAVRHARDVAIANIDPDIVYVTSLFEGYDDDFTVSIPKESRQWKTVTVCHDLIPLLNRERYLGDPNYHKFYMDRLAEFELADAVYAISNSVVDEVLKHTNVPRERILNISSAVGDEFCVHTYDAGRQGRIKSRYKLPGQFILSLAMIEPRKNIEALIEAYALLPKALQSDYPLVLAYKVRPEELARIKALAQSHGVDSAHLIFTGYLPDDDLIALYNLCKVFVFPSVHEGFGLPALEAMKCGAATLASNVTSLPEVIGWDEAMFDPYDVRDLSGTLERALSDDAYWADLKNHALTQAEKFSWDRTAQMAIAGFDDLLEKRPGIPGGPTRQRSGDDIKSDVLGALRRQKKLTDADMLGLAWAIARNSFRDHRRKLLMDISVLAEHDAKTGIQRVSRSILNALLSKRIPGYDVRAIRYANGDCYRYANRFVKRNFGIDFGADEPVLFGKDDVVLVTDLTCHLFPAIESQFDMLRRAGGKLYFVIHDIMALRHPEWCDEGIRRWFPLWLPSLAYHANGLICVSAFVADDVRNWLHEHAGSFPVNPYLTIDNFHLGADIDSSLPSKGLPKSAPALLSRMAEAQSFIMVGTMEPRKGHAQVLRAFERLWDEGKQYNLFIVGKQGWNVDDLCSALETHLRRDRNLFWLQDISDEFLNLLYDKSSALIFASMGEGFGLPLIEAAHKELPLILRRIPVFEEIAGNHAFYFEKDQPADLALAIEKWIEMREKGLHPRSAGMPWLTWEQSKDLLLSKLPLIQPAETDRRQSDTST
ncbi:glycosyltransferase family 1 protein [Rhizobium sp. P44RR-XXIV]|uniref:glycosyltransferase family 4 protein n=1 Tax=Rhizobium sp. P44RR-XXIV TaxID=1921145 RepID=UPI0024849EF6|nr:glycosyltransferase family 1 protein [Rhizobium sp. P44RR-XXIV]